MRRLLQPHIAPGKFKLITMTTTTQRNTIDQKYLLNTMSYAAYRQLVSELLAQGKVTGPQQSESLLNYSKMNVQRMQRIDKTVQVLPEVRAVITAIQQPQTWLVLTEGWCGDAAQILPVLNAMAQLNPAIELKLLLRDEHLDLMDQYLTNGKSRSIPKLIAIDNDSMQELFNWGPRPTVLQQSFNSMRAEDIAGSIITEKIHSWYAKDKTVTTQKEIAGLLQGVQ